MADCVFCRIVSGEVPAHRVLEDDVIVAFLDARPVFKGHVLVVPREHHETLADLELGGRGVDKNLAFTTGFLFFVVTIALSLPGAAILAREGLRTRG